MPIYIDTYLTSVFLLFTSSLKTRRSLFFEVEKAVEIMCMSLVVWAGTSDLLVRCEGRKCGNETTGAHLFLGKKQFSISTKQRNVNNINNNKRDSSLNRESLCRGQGQGERSRMVRLLVKRGDEVQFLFETSVAVETEEVIREVARIYNARLKVGRICVGKASSDTLTSRNF